MPLYRTSADTSLDRLIEHLDWVGEEVISVERENDEWLVITKPLAKGSAARNVYVAGKTETRPA